VCVCVCARARARVRERERERERENHIKCIEDASEAKVSTLGCNWIIHCEEKNSHEHMSNSEWLPRQSLFIVLISSIHNIRRPDALVQLGYIWRQVSAVNRPPSGQQGIVLHLNNSIALIR